MRGTDPLRRSALFPLSLSFLLVYCGPRSDGRIESYALSKFFASFTPSSLSLLLVYASRLLCPIALPSVSWIDGRIGWSHGQNGLSYIELCLFERFLRLVPPKTASHTARPWRNLNSPNRTPSAQNSARNNI